MVTAKMDMLLDKRSKRLIIEHQKEQTASPSPSAEPPVIFFQAAKTETREIQAVNSEPIQQTNEPISSESEHETSAEIETIESNQDQEIQEINIKTENVTDDLPEETLQEVIHHKSGPIREEGPDYIIYRPERKTFEKTDSGGFKCSDCPYTNSKYSLGRVSN